MMNNDTASREYRSLNDKLQSRGQNFTALMRCPSTGAPLMRTDEGLISEADTRIIYQVTGTRVDLLSDEQRNRFARQEQQERDEFTRKGWKPLSIPEFRRLPQGSPDSWSAAYWEQRSAATIEMWRLLEEKRRNQKQLPIGALGVAIDFSAGMGWLGYALDFAGYNTMVISEHSGEYGLDVFAYSRYIRVYGSLTEPPIAGDSFDLVTFSFSLEKLDKPSLALQNAARLLKANGTMIVMSESKDHLIEAEQTLQNAQLAVEQQKVRGAGSVVGRTLKSVMGRGLTFPPIVIARRN